MLPMSNMYARPCVEGNSSTGQYFDYSLSSSNCHSNNSENCTALGTLPGATIYLPIFLFLAGISGQIVSLVYLHHSSRPASHRKTFYVMLSTLIWTDLIGKLITTPLPVISYAYGTWFGGENTCNLHGYCMSVIGIVTHLLVAAIALERFLGVRCPYYYEKTVTNSKTRILMVGIWVFGLTYCSMPFVGLGEFKLHHPGSWCHINQHLCPDNPWWHTAFANLYSVMNLICLLLVVIFNLVVVHSLLKMRMTKTLPSAARPSLTKDTELQMIILLVILTVIFIISWTTLDVLMIMNQLFPVPPDEYPRLDLKAIRLVSINQIADPWTYIICRMVFRSRTWKHCRRVLVGKISTKRRLSRLEKGEGESRAFYSMSAPKRRLSALTQLKKRTSLPNFHFDVKVITTYPKEQLHQEKKQKESPDKECENNFQKCPSTESVSKKKRRKRKQCIPLSYTVTSLNENSPNKLKSTIYSVEEESSSSKHLTEHHDKLLPPQDKKLQTNGHGGSLYINRSMDVLSQAMTKKEERNGLADESRPGENESPFTPFLEDKSSSSQRVRCNSWCCPDKYTLASKVKPTKV